MQYVTKAGSRQRRKPGENRERLMVAAIHVFGKHGYHGALTTNIAELADVPQPHVYANFATKQALYLACVERVAETLVTKKQTQLIDSQHKHFAANKPLNTETIYRFVFQMISCCADQQFSNELTASLKRIQSHLPEEEFHSIILQASESLMNDH